jgi:hypothetical protein
LSTTELYTHQTLPAARQMRLRDLLGPPEIRQEFVPVVALSAPVQADVVEVVRLYNTIEEATAHCTHPIIQFVSADRNAANAEAAYALAWIGATLFGKRVLFIDAGKATSRWKMPLSLGSDPRKVLLDVALGHASPEEAMVTGEDLSLFAATLQHDRAGGSAMLAVPQIKVVLEHLRTSFDMIIIAPPSSLDEPMAAILKTIVNGSIIVVEAGLSRAGRVGQCASLLSSGDSLLIGAVMWRKNPIPRLLRRWF